MFTAFILFLLICSILLVYFGVLAFSIFWRYILPVLLVLFVVRLIISGILLLFNPVFWVMVLIFAAVIWSIRRVN